MIKKKIYYIIIILIIILSAISGCIFMYNHLSKDNNNNNNNKVNLVFITDDNYKKYTQVAILSAILNKNKSSIYDISILCVDINKKDMEEYNKLVKYDKYNNNNIIINTIPVTLESIKDVGNYEISHPYASRADLFKFFLPDILKDKDKVLYIDGDTIIRKDLLELYNTNLKNRYLGAVKIFYQKNHTWHKIINNWYYRTIVYNYNCGVMLMNLKKMREDDLKTKFINWKQNDKERILMSQDTFNEVIPLKSIIKLSPIYNFRIGKAKDMKTYTAETFRLYNFKKLYFPHLVNITSYEDFEKMAAIVHFPKKYKPWCYLDMPYASEWWRYAKMVDTNWIREEMCNKREKHIKLDLNKKNIENIRNMPDIIKGDGKEKDSICDDITKISYQLFTFPLIPNIARIYSKY